MDKTLPPEAPALTLAQAIERINYLRPLVQQYMDDSFKKCAPDLTGLAQALMLYDSKVFTAEQTLKNMRRILDIPAMPEMFELGRLQKDLYLGHFHGEASQPRVGGHYDYL